MYDVAGIRKILAAGQIAHVGVATDDGPIVLPMAYGVRSGPRGDELLIHGSVANAMMRAGRGLDVCVTVTIVDGLVVARTPFHNSMNYRSVVVRGMATAITEADDKVAALQVINDHIAPIWDTARPPSESDLKQTLVLALPLTEASAKVRAGDPIDEAADLDGPHWAGVAPHCLGCGDRCDGPAQWCTRSRFSQCSRRHGRTFERLSTDWGLRPGSTFGANEGRSIASGRWTGH